MGAVVGVVGVVVSQGVLVWAAGRAVRVAWAVWQGGGDAVADGGIGGLVKRRSFGAESGGGGGGTDGLVLHAMVSHVNQFPSATAAR